MPASLLTLFFLSAFGGGCIADHRIAFISYKEEGQWINATGRDTTLDAADVQRTKKLICEAVKAYNKKHTGNFRIQPLHRYYIQCVPYVDSAGHVKVWVQGSAGKPNGEAWKKQIMMIMDGGNSVFSLEVDLTDNIARNIGINGWG